MSLKGFLWRPSGKVREGEASAEPGSVLGNLQHPPWFRRHHNHRQKRCVQEQ